MPEVDLPPSPAPHSPRGRGIRRLKLALGHSMAGILSAFDQEEALRIEAILFFAGVFFAPFFAEDPVEFVLLVGVLLLVLIVELLNCAIERTVDRISLERHDLSKQAKDAGSAAVFLSLILAGLVWVFVGLF